MVQRTARRFPEPVMRVQFPPGAPFCYGTLVLGGGGGIRTLGPLAGTMVFKTIALDRYATPPLNYTINYS